ncbi:MAG: apolipoprotein N-acyltransferase [Parachlamydiales bacterium]|nr:apolipoprotein N-acyltransferase [Parachlamydiales bacterium]
MTSFTFAQRVSLILISLVIVSLGQPSNLPLIGVIASTCGYALFWLGLKKRSFVIPFIWFSLIQLYQLSWMTSYEYVGPYILIVYAFLCLAVGAQFGLISYCIPYDKPLSTQRLMALCALWSIFEWARLFFISGYTWNPTGLALACTDFSRQWASIGGIYWLSFWVILVNLMLFKLVKSCLKTTKAGWIICVSLPYIFGAAFIAWHDLKKDSLNQNPYHVALVQTAMLPEEKFPYYGEKAKMLYTPLEQWQRVLYLLRSQKHNALDLIVLPEAVVPYGSFKPLTAFQDLEYSFEKILGSKDKTFFPPLKPPLAHMITDEGEPFWGVGNAYWAQTIANYFASEVVAGLEDFEMDGTKSSVSYQAAFHFAPFKEEWQRYEKQILVPMAEYVPYAWCREIAKKWGIIYFFTPGTVAKVFKGKLKLGASICYEETFGNLVRQNRVQGAEIFVNVTNDIWYPNSMLPQQHFELGRLRTVENGVPLVRACNNGVTSAVDSFGRVLKILGEDEGEVEWSAGAINIEVPTYNYNTIYSYFGDMLVVGFSLILLIVYALDHYVIKRKVLAHKPLSN